MKRSFRNSNQLFRAVSKTVPLASQTFSKSYLQYVQGASPLFITHGKGSHVWDVDGNEYIDFINGLLSVILGYRYKAVDDAIKQQLLKGIIFSLPSPLEYDLAKLLVKHIPSAEMVRFGKNGSDVTTGAVRLARAVTGKEHIATCGYHGWHDWYIGSTTRKRGVPKSTQKLTHRFTYNDIDSLTKIFRKHKGRIAAVIMEPINYINPKNNFLQKIKILTHKNGALLIFDEIITGFRFNLGGAQKLFKVTPDLATFGKSMANGMPLAALVGKRKYMKEIENIFFSFTFGGETLSLVAAIATIREMEKKNVISILWQKGKYLQERTTKLLKENKLDNIISVRGKPCWQVFVVSDTKHATVNEIKSFIQQELVSKGFLWLGQHNMSFSHTKKDIDALIRAYREIFPQLRNALDEKKVRKSLKGKPITDILKIR